MGYSSPPPQQFYSAPAASRSKRSMLHEWRDRLFFAFRNILVFHRPLTLHVKGRPFELLPAGSVAQRIWIEGRFDRGAVNFLLDLLPPSSVFIDVGANSGLFAIPAAQALTDGKVFAFEWEPDACRLLKQNTEINDLHNLHISCVAVSESNAGGSLLPSLVPAIALDDFLSMTPAAAAVRVVRIAADGAELFILRGARRLLSSPDAPLLIYDSTFLTRRYAYHPVETFWFLQRCGYSFFILDSRNGRVSRPANHRAYGTTVVAAKPTHPAHQSLEDSTS